MIIHRNGEQEFFLLVAKNIFCIFKKFLHFLCVSVFCLSMPMVISHQGGVELVTQGVAHAVEGHHGDEQHEAR